MYIGKLGDGTAPDDGIYVLIKEVMDNSVDEFIMGAGKVIEITVEGKAVTIRDYGRGIPLKSLAAAVSEMIPADTVRPLSKRRSASMGSASRP